MRNFILFSVFSYFHCYYYYFFLSCLLSIYLYLLILLWLLAMQTTTTTFISYCNGIHGVFACFGSTADFSYNRRDQPYSNVACTLIFSVVVVAFASCPPFPVWFSCYALRLSLFVYDFSSICIWIFLCGQTHIWNAMRIL